MDFNYAKIFGFEFSPKDPETCGRDHKKFHYDDKMDDELKFWDHVRVIKKMIANEYKEKKYGKCVAAYHELLNRVNTYTRQLGALGNNFEYAALRHDILRDLAQSNFMKGDYQSALDSVRASLRLNHSDDKCYVIALRASAAINSWNVFADAVVETFKYNVFTAKVRDIYIQHVPSLPNTVMEYILNAAPPALREAILQYHKNFGNKVPPPQPKKVPVKKSPNVEKSNTCDSPTPPKPPVAPAPTKKPAEPVVAKAVEEPAYNEYKSICKEAAEAHGRGWDCLESYENALKLARALAPKHPRLAPTEIVVIQFIITECQLETCEYVKISAAVTSLKTLSADNAHWLPAIFVNLAKGFYLLNRFQLALEWVNKGNEYLRKGIRFSKQFYPGTNITLKLTSVDFITTALGKLYQDCSVFHPPDAICRYDGCERLNKHHIAPLKDIYYSDPDFDGFVSLTCSLKCESTYHPCCWKEWKSKIATEPLKLTDQRLLGRKCFTPDCEGDILNIKHHCKDGTIKSQKEAAKEEGPKTARPDISKYLKKPEGEQKEPVKNKKSADREKPSRPPLQETTSVVSLPQNFYKPIKASIKIQTEPADVQDRYCQTVPVADQNAIKLQQAEAELSGADKKYEKLRQKYLALKDHAEQLENMIVTNRNEERAKAVNIWKPASEMLINNWLFYCNEQIPFLEMIKNNVTHADVQIRSEELLQEWYTKKLLVKEIQEDFLRECLISPSAHVSLELPDLPEYPPNTFPPIEVIETLTNLKLADPVQLEERPTMLQAPVVAPCDSEIAGISNGACAEYLTDDVVERIFGASPTPSEMTLPDDFSPHCGNGVHPNGYDPAFDLDDFEVNQIPMHSGVDSFLDTLSKGHEKTDDFNRPASHIPATPSEHLPAETNAGGETTPVYFGQQMNGAHDIEVNGLSEATTLGEVMEAPGFIAEEIIEAPSIELPACEVVRPVNAPVNEEEVVDYDGDEEEWEEMGEEEEESEEEEANSDDGEDSEVDDSDNDVTYNASTRNRFMALKKAQLISSQFKEPARPTQNHPTNHQPMVCTTSATSVSSAATTPTRPNPQPRAPPSASVSRPRFDSHRSVSSVEGACAIPTPRHPPKSVYSRLMSYIFSQPQFACKSEEELRRALEAIRQENRNILRSASLPDILTMLQVKLNENTARRIVLNKFTELAWGTPVPPAVPRQKLPLKKTLGECPICFEAMSGRTDIFTLTCSHAYHYDCIHKWIKSDRTCPLCREYVLPPEEFPALS